MPFKFCTGRFTVSWSISQCFTFTFLMAACYVKRVFWSNKPTENHHPTPHLPPVYCSLLRFVGACAPWFSRKCCTESKRSWGVHPIDQEVGSTEEKGSRSECPQFTLSNVSQTGRVLLYARSSETELCVVLFVPSNEGRVCFIVQTINQLCPNNKMIWLVNQSNADWVKCVEIYHDVNNTLSVLVNPFCD